MVSPNSGTLDMTNIKVQYPATRSFSIKLKQNRDTKVKHMYFKRLLGFDVQFCTHMYLGMHKEWYIPCSERTCRNSGHVRRAPMILNSAKVVFQRVKTPRISIFGRVDMYCWPPKISNMYRPAAQVIIVRQFSCKKESHFLITELKLDLIYILSTVQL